MISTVDCFWDYAGYDRKTAHYSLIDSYVCANGGQYPDEYRMFAKRDWFAAENTDFRSHKHISSGTDRSSEQLMIHGGLHE